MKRITTALAAIAVSMVAAPAFTTTAEAHRQGEICRYQSIQRDGRVTTGSDYCHHLPSQYRERPRSGFTLYFDFSDGWYFADRPRRGRDRDDDSGPRGQDQVCLVTFFKRSQVEGGANTNVERAQLLPRQVARRRDGPNDRQRIFDYGNNSQNRKTCRMLNNINN